MKTQIGLINKMLNNLKINLVPDFEGRLDVEEGSMYGRITIGDYYETFYMSPSVWSISDYQRQWKLSWERINKRQDSCFVVNLQNDPFVEIWAVYFYPGVAYFQNYLIVEGYKEFVGNLPFTPESSINFIPPRETVTEDGYKVSEWKLEI